MEHPTKAAIVLSVIGEQLAQERFVYRYVTRGAFYESALAAGLNPETASVWDQQLIARVALYSPGGILARDLAKNPTVLVVNDTVFAHGGLLPIHCECNSVSFILALGDLSCSILLV